MRQTNTLNRAVEASCGCQDGHPWEPLWGILIWVSFAFYGTFWEHAIGYYHSHHVPSGSPLGSSYLSFSWPLWDLRGAPHRGTLIWASLDLWDLLGICYCSPLGNPYLGFSYLLWDLLGTCYWLLPLPPCGPAPRWEAPLWASLDFYGTFWEHAPGYYHSHHVP